MSPTILPRRRTITVELTEADARGYLERTGPHGDSPVAVLHRAIEAALPPEYVRGALYRVTCRDAAAEVGFWDGCAFLLPSYAGNSIAGYRRAQREDVVKVEPVRVLGDYEVAVRKINDGTLASAHRDRADMLAEQGYEWSAHLHRAYADALDKADQ